MFSVKIKTENLNKATPVYRWCQRRHQTQPAYVELDCRDTGTLVAGYNRKPGYTTPNHYWHKHVVRWSIPPETTGTDLQTLFSSPDFLVSCQRIVAGFDESWNGSNWVGAYTEDAQAAIENARQAIMNIIDAAQVYSAKEWLFSDGYVLEDYWDYQSISAAIADIEIHIISSHRIREDIEKALIDQAASDYIYHPNRLTGTHIKELVTRKMISALDADEWLRNERIAQLTKIRNSSRKNKKNHS